MKKRLFSLLLTLCLVVSLLPAQNVTAEGTEDIIVSEAEEIPEVPAEDIQEENLEETADTANEDVMNVTADAEQTNTPEYTGIYFRAGDATVTLYQDGEVRDASSVVCAIVPVGETMAENGYTVSNPVYWEPTRPFAGWLACTYEELPDGQGSAPVQIPGTNFMTSEEAMNYPALPDDELTFIAQWVDDEADYYSSVEIDGYGGEFEITYTYEDGSGNSNEMNGDYFNCREGYTVAESCWEEMGITPVITKDPVMEDDTFEGWLKYIWFDEMWTLIDETPYTSEDVMGSIVSGEDMIFVAKWESIDMEEYHRYGQEGGDYPGGEENFVPEGETLTVVTLNQKYAVAPAKDSYFTFTAPKTGYYAFHSDNQYDTFCYNYWSAMWIDCQIGYAVITLQEGQEYMIAVSGDEGYNIWFTETVGITDLEILKQDTSKVFPRSNGVYWESLWEGMTVKATFSDGTTKTYELDDNTYDLDGFDIYLDYDLESAGDTATVTMCCGFGVASFIVNVEKEYVTDFEVISETPVIEVTENTMGWFSADEESGESYYVYYAERFVNEKAKFLFTWSDGTQEEVTFDPYEFPHMYHGIHMEYYRCEEVQHEDHWTVGNTYTFDMVYGEFTVPVQVKIVESPVQKVEVLTQMTELLGEPAFELYEGAWHLIDPDWTKLEIRVTMKDGTAKTYTFEDWVFADDGYVYLDDYQMDLYPSEASEEGLTGPGKYYVDLLVDGKMTTFYVEGVEKIVADNTVTVAPSVMEEQLGASTEIKVEAKEAPVVNLPAASVDKVAATNADLKISLNNAQVTISQAAMDTIASKTAGQAEEVILSVQPVDESALSAAQKALIDDVKAETETGAAVVLDITLEVDGVAVTSFGGQITVRIPFTAPAGTNGSDFAVYYLSEDGKTVQKMPTTYADGYLTFVTDHFSDYVALNADPEGTVVYTPATGSTAGGNGGTAGTVKPGAPATGDNAPVVGLIVMLCCSGLMAAAFLTLRKKFRV